MGLLLAAVDVAAPLRWRWELRDEATGEVIAGHHVALDSGQDAERVAAFGDMYEYVRLHADPLWRADEPRIIREAGLWASGAVLGDAITTAISAAAPTTVLVLVPAPADQVLLWPLELAFADGAPLAARGDVSFVYCMGHAAAVLDEQVRPVRVLAAFSLPESAGAVAMRRERHELAELIRQVANRDGVAIELQVLQYGVTRRRLSEVAGSGEGWDVVHLSGHGDRAGFALERLNGSTDYVSTADLVDLLRPAAGRLKLAVLASCKSAAEATTDRLRLLGLPGKSALGAEFVPDQATGHVTGLARGLAEELGCAVVATRYPVSDDFLCAFDQAFYERMLSGGDPVGMASARALAAVLGGVPGIQAASLGVFGASAAGLVLRAAPERPGAGRTAIGTAAGRMAVFPAQPERFVGRGAIMTAASTGLRAGSGTTAVLLHGMPGIGKSACVLELAYLHQDQFDAAAFWRPPAGSDPDLGLRSLAEALHKQLGESGTGFALPPRWGGRRWNTYARRLRENMRASSVLIVIDNLEGLLSPDGSWFDARWEAIFDALAGHGGTSRLVAASRFTPASFARAPAGPLLLLPVGPLPQAEAAVLARELPGLRGLMYDGQSPAAAHISRFGAGCRRAWEVLDRVQGHPGLLELADVAVSARAMTAAEADRERAEHGIAEWTAATLAVLPFDATLMACFVAGLEPADRRLPVILETWAGLWRRQGKPGAPPSPGPLLDTLSAAMLTGYDDQQQACLMHPAVAAAISARPQPTCVMTSTANSEPTGKMADTGPKAGPERRLPPCRTWRDGGNGTARLHCSTT